MFREYLILRLRNAAIDMDRQGNHNLAELMTEAVEELENGSEQTPQNLQPGRHSGRNAP